MCRNCVDGRILRMASLCHLSQITVSFVGFQSFTPQLNQLLWVIKKKQNRMRYFPENTLGRIPRENASKVPLYRNQHQTLWTSPETHRSKSALTSHFLLHALLIHAVWAGLHASSSRCILNVRRIRVLLASWKSPTNVVYERRIFSTPAIFLNKRLNGLNIKLCGTPNTSFIVFALPILHRGCKMLAAASIECGLPICMATWLQQHCTFIAGEERMR